MKPTKTRRLDPSRPGRAVGHRRRPRWRPRPRRGRRRRRRPRGRAQAGQPLIVNALGRPVGPQHRAERAGLFHRRRRAGDAGRHQRAGAEGRARLGGQRDQHHAGVRGRATPSRSSTRCARSRCGRRRSAAIRRPAQGLFGRRHPDGQGAAEGRADLRLPELGDDGRQARPGRHLRRPGRADHPAHLQSGRAAGRRGDGAGQPRPDAARPAASSSG